MTPVRDGMLVATHRDDAPGGAAAGMAPLVPPPADRRPQKDRDLLVIGAGPAGLAAAEAAARAGVCVTVLDERPHPGGQYFKQLAPSHRFAGPRAADRQFASGAALIERVRAVGAEIVSSATVWCVRACAPAGAGGDAGAAAAEVDALVDGRAQRYRARPLVIAAIIGRHLTTCVSEGNGNRFANAAGATRDQCYARHVVILLFGTRQQHRMQLHSR